MCSGNPKLLPIIFQLLEEIEKTQYNIEDNTIIEAAKILINEMLSHLSDQVRREIMANLSEPPTHWSILHLTCIGGECGKVW